MVKGYVSGQKSFSQLNFKLAKHILEGKKSKPAKKNNWKKRPRSENWRDNRNTRKWRNYRKLQTELSKNKKSYRERHLRGELLLW